MLFAGPIIRARPHKQQIQYARGQPFSKYHERCLATWKLKHITFIHMITVKQFLYNFYFNYYAPFGLMREGSQALGSELRVNL